MRFYLIDKVIGQFLEVTYIVPNSPNPPGSQAILPNGTLVCLSGIRGPDGPRGFTGATGPRGFAGNYRQFESHVSTFEKWQIGA